MRPKIVAGNWKMNLLAQEADQLVESLASGALRETLSATAILCPPAIYLQRVLTHLRRMPNVCVGAQDCSAYRAGAYTGEIAAPMLASLGVSHVILGHSERRQYAAEDAVLLARKVDRVLEAGLKPIFCCGEPMEVRRAGQQDQFVRMQLKEGLFHLPPQAFEHIIVAYEPIWAIGSGTPATADQAQAMHATIRACLAELLDELAERVPILYGGSVGADNARELFSCPDVDGGLVGGASLRADAFSAILQSC